MADIIKVPAVQGRMRQRLHDVFLGARKEISPNEKHHESNLVWGPIAIGCSIVLPVVAAMKHDLRFLFFVAWPCFTFGVWHLCKRIPYKALSYWTVGISCVLVAGALWGLNLWLAPHQTETLKLSGEFGRIAFAPTGPTGNDSVVTAEFTVINQGDDPTIARNFTLTVKDSHGADHVFQMFPAPRKNLTLFEGNSREGRNWELATVDWLPYKASVSAIPHFQECDGWVQGIALDLPYKSFGNVLTMRFSDAKGNFYVINSVPSFPAPIVDVDGAMGQNHQLSGEK
jgi:hypothetical protein